MSLMQSTVMIEVVRAKLADAPAVCVALRRSIAEVCGSDYSHIEGFVENWLKNKTPENVAIWIENPAAYFIIARACNSDIVAGVGSLSRAGEVLLCYVIPEYLGRGVGRSILEALEMQALEWGIQRLTTLSTITARDFYARQGFRPCGSTISESGYEIEIPMAKEHVI